MAAKLVNLFALSTLAILLCSFAPSQSLALTVQGNHVARHIPNHHGIAKKKKKRGNCKPRSSSSSPPATTPASQPTNTPAQGNNVNNGNNNNNYPSSSSSTPNSTPTTTPSTITTTHSGGKLAIAWAMENDARIRFLVASTRVAMFHLWSPNIPQAVKDSGIRVSIMLWNTSPDRVSDFVAKAQPGYADYAAGFNEVNEVTQGYTSVSDAIGAWRTYLNPLVNSGYGLGSPSTTSAPNGFEWMTDFFNQCSDCHVDDVLIHWYDVKFVDLKAYVDKWAGFGKPLRITEFACQNFNGGDQPSSDDIWSFTTQAIQYLEGNPVVQTYAPFGFMDDLYNVNPADGLFAPDNLSALGWLYVTGI